MDELEDEHYDILAVLDEGRASTFLIRQHGGFSDRYDDPEDERATVHQRLDTLTNYGYARKIVRGMYEITDRGERKLSDRRGE